MVNPWFYFLKYAFKLQLQKSLWYMLSRTISYNTFLYHIIMLKADLFSVSVPHCNHITVTWNPNMYNSNVTLFKLSILYKFYHDYCKSVHEIEAGIWRMPLTLDRYTFSDWFLSTAPFLLPLSSLTGLLFDKCLPVATPLHKLVMPSSSLLLDPSRTANYIHS